jgi:hypothetical protein
VQELNALGEVDDIQHFPEGCGVSDRGTVSG